jgi:GTP-binding protein
MMRTYFEGRPSLCAVILLFDIRRIPRAEELMLIDWTRQYDIPLIPVVTKADKITKGQRAKHVKDISAASGIDANEFILFSTVSREGREAIWGRIEAATAGFTLSQVEGSERSEAEVEPEE